jgi:hypothetical protein
LQKKGKGGNINLGKEAMKHRGARKHERIAKQQGAKRYLGKEAMKHEIVAKHIRMMKHRVVKHITTLKKKQ